MPKKFEYEDRYTEREDDHDDEVLFGENTFDFQKPQHDFYKPHASAGISDWSPSLTRQEFAEECDINTIMAQYERTGVINHVARSDPMYLDYTSVPRDLQSAMNFMRDASSEFMRLPAHVRKEFDNDPSRFVAFAEDPKNVEKMRSWDLAKRPPEAAKPILVEMATPPGGDLPKPPAAS
jgi:phage internal scaffolding protein